ncbi:translation initiation factor IF-2-like [Phacochoerus africanus]|uniref:translation initiation factor IF-2-like n=1 Tax=Phacochoerus africanus TaxID=41426 RepID=UPI001FDA46CB|nr:translation initiation factor IF-2-like [Phacochoerus africanus]
MPGSARSRRREEERQRETGGEPNRALPQRQPRLRVRPQTRPRPQTHPSTPSKDGAGAAAPRRAARLWWAAPGQRSPRGHSEKGRGVRGTRRQPAPALGRLLLAVPRPLPDRPVLALVSKAPAERGGAQRAATPPTGGPGMHPRASGGSNCTSGGGGRPGPGPAGREPQERERAEEGEEEGKEEERSPVRTPLGLHGPRLGPYRGGGGSFSGRQTFRGDALRGEVQPPKRTGQPLSATCAPRAPGARGPQGKDSSTSWAAGTPPAPAPAPGPARWPRPRATRHPQFLQGPPAMSDPDIPRGPDVPAMWPPCSRGA